MDDQLQKAADAIYVKTQAGESISKVLGGLYSKRQIRIPYSTQAGKAEIDSMDLSVRSYNCLKRADINTINDLIQYAEAGKNIRTIRNLGAKSGVEIYERLLDCCYQALSDNEKKEFLMGFVSENEKNRR